MLLQMSKHFGDQLAAIQMSRARYLHLLLRASLLHRGWQTQTETGEAIRWIPVLQLLEPLATALLLGVALLVMAPL